MTVLFYRSSSSKSKSVRVNFGAQHKRDCFMKSKIVLHLEIRQQVGIWINSLLSPLDSLDTGAGASILIRSQHFAEIHDFLIVESLTATINASLKELMPVLSPKRACCKTERYSKCLYQSGLLEVQL